MSALERPRVAIAGAGAAGLLAALRLAGRFDVEVLEASARVGGHIRPIDVDGVRVDTAFLGYKPQVYPTLTRLLAELGIPTEERTITGGVCFARQGLCFSRLESEQQGWPAELAVERKQQRAFLLLLARGLKNGVGELPNVPLRDHLAASGFGDAMVRQVIAPDVASIWGIQPEDALGMSVRGAVGSLLTVGKGVHVFPASSEPYREAMLGRLREAGVQVTPSVTVDGIESTGDGVMLREDGVPRRFRAVVVACPAERAHAMLAPAERERHAALARVHYVPTMTVVHRGAALRSLFGRHFGTFNYLEDDRGQATVTWDLARLFGTPHPDVYLTAGPPSLLETDADRFGEVLDVAQHRHCVHTPASIAAAEEVERCNGEGGIHFAGSYLGLAPVHEAAVASAERVAARLASALVPSASA
jgi:predicted NAD/FAD-binding protein